MKAPFTAFRVSALALALAIGLALGFASPAIADGASLDQLLKGTAGAVAGGVVGSQIGNGTGKTAATAAGAALGSVIASGCKVSTGTVVGGVLGGLLGSQVGGGNGKNAMVGVGAAVGAWLGSDCSPVAMASAPVALSGPPFRFNGLTMTPVSGFPIEAFQGVPPIVTTEDLAAAREVVKALTASAAQSYRDGDAETAMLKMYWAKRIGLVALSVSGSSLAAMSSIKVAPQNTAQRVPQSRAQMGGASVTATVPPKTLVILPAFDQEGTSQDRLAELVAGPRLAAIDWSAGVRVADNGNSFLNTLGSIGKMMGGAQQGNGATQQQGNNGQMGVPVDFMGLKDGQVLKMDSGASVMKSAGSLTIYNPGDQAVSIPLDKLDFVPRMPTPSAERQAAAGLMKAINANANRWAFGDYKRRVGMFNLRFDVPNRLLDAWRGSSVVAYVDGFGTVTSQRVDGEQSYHNDRNYRLAANLTALTDKSPVVNDFKQKCMAESLGAFDELGGKFANTLKKICFSSGSYNNGNTNQVATRTFWIGEDGKAIQTTDSLLNDKAIVETMKKVLNMGKAASDLLAFAPTVGNVESGLQCVGATTMAQYSAVAMGFGTTPGTGLAKGRLAGWTPQAEEWGLDRVANCVGAIPVLGNVVGKLAKGAGTLSGKAVLASLPETSTVLRALDAFEAPTSFRKFVDGAKDAAELMPGNPLAASFVKRAYDVVMSGQTLAQAHGAGGFFYQELRN